MKKLSTIGMTISHTTMLLKSKDLSWVRFQYILSVPIDQAVSLVSGLIRSLKEKKSSIVAIENALIENSFKMIKLRIHRSNARSVARANAAGYKLLPELAGVSLDHYVKDLTLF